MLYGIIKHVDRDRGYGFIGQERGPDVFFLLITVENPQEFPLRPRQAVSFELEPRRSEADRLKGPRARLVRLLAQMPGGVLPPPPQELAVKHHPRARQKKPSWRRSS